MNILRRLFLFLVGVAAIASSQAADPADLPVLRWAADPDSNAPYTFYGPNNQLTGF
jgi:ABC-type amino acid transport substrate-binding protein